MTEHALNRFEVARMLGARALQLSFGAPPLINVEEGMIDSIELARREFEADLIPLTVLNE